jgi:hypothetical protein
VSTSASRLDPADIFVILQDALTQSGQNHFNRGLEYDGPPLFGAVQDLLAALGTEEQALASDLEGLMELLAFLLANKLHGMLKNKFGVGDAAQRVLNRLSPQTQATIGLLLSALQSKKTR